VNNAQAVLDRLNALLKLVEAGGNEEMKDWCDFGARIYLMRNELVDALTSQAQISQPATPKKEGE
jgi:hypothetical protein